MAIRSASEALVSLVVAIGLAMPVISRAQGVGKIQGHVWIPSGEPLGSVVVVVTPVSGGRVAKRTTDAAGRFEFEVPAYMNYRVQAEMVGFDVGQKVVGVGPGSVSRVAFVLSAGVLVDRPREVRGEVVDEQARPLSDVYVTASGFNDGIDRTVLTDSSGAFVFERISSKPLVVIAMAPGASAAATVPASHGARSVRLVLSKMLSESVQ